jgi:hypothetical protein
MSSNDLIIMTLEQSNVTADRLDVPAFNEHKQDGLYPFHRLAYYRSYLKTKTMKVYQANPRSKQ